MQDRRHHAVPANGDGGDAGPRAGVAAGATVGSGHEGEALRTTGMRAGALRGPGPAVGAAEARPRGRDRHREGEPQERETSPRAEPHRVRHRSYGTTRTPASQPRGCGAPSSRTARKRSAFAITETELRLMAAAAIIGDSTRPSHG